MRVRHRSVMGLVVGAIAAVASLFSPGGKAAAAARVAEYFESVSGGRVAEAMAYFEPGPLGRDKQAQARVSSFVREECRKAKAYGGVEWVKVVTSRREGGLLKLATAVKYANSPEVVRQSIAMVTVEGRWYVHVPAAGEVVGGLAVRK